MRRFFGNILILFGLLIVIQTCKKDSQIERVFQTVNQSMGIKQVFQYDLGAFGDEEGASISKQANNFSLSSLERGMSTGKIAYRYSPASNFFGTDEVEIKSARGSEGASPNTKIVYTTIKFTINN